MGTHPEEQPGDGYEESPSTGPSARPVEGETAAKRREHAEITATGATETDTDVEKGPEKGVDLLIKGREVRRIEKLVKKAKKEVIRIFKRATSGITTQRGTITADNMTLILRYPLDQLEKEWIERVRAIHAESGSEQDLINLRGEYGSLEGKTGRIYDAVQSVQYYVDNMRKEDGWITPERLAEIAYSVNSKATIIADLLADRENTDLVDAFRWAINMKGAEAKDAAIVALERHSLKHFPDGELMQPTWMILSYTDRATRVAVAENFKAENPSKLADFLERGNALGVYSPDEIEKISGTTIEAGKRETLALRWKAAHDFSKETKRLTVSSYGVSNAAAEMLTGKNALMFLGQLAAGATIAANLVVGVTKGDAWKSPAAMVQLATNHNIIAGGVVLGAIHHIKKGKRLGETFAGTEERQTIASRQAVMDLSEEIGGNPLWPQWDGFFSGDNHAGSRVFFDFVQKNKTKKGEYPEHRFTVAGFRRYLESEQTSANPDQKDLDYAALARRFEGDLARADDKSILSLAKVFDDFKIGGATAQANYDKAIEEAKKI